jgi:hypothetical protein
MDTIERATRRDWIAPLVFLALGALGALFALRFYDRAFPEASIDLRLSRKEISAQAKQFLGGRGIATEGYRSFTVFDYDDKTKAYLEQELGVAEAGRLMAGPLDFWRWKTRFIRPPQREEATVWLTPSGTLAGFDHQVEENRPGARLSKDAAQRIAEIFLRTERGFDLARFRQVGEQAQERPHRLDYTFTWESRDVRAGQAALRVSVTVLGDEVSGFSEFLQLPGDWVRGFERLRGREFQLGITVTVLQFLLTIAAVALLVVQARRGRLRWKTALGFGILVSGLFAAWGLNNLGLSAASMATDQSYQSWLILELLGSVGDALFIGAWTALLVGASEPLYREMMPERVSLGRLFTLSGIRSREFLTSTLVGYGMAGIHIGLLVVLYLVARGFGVWIPLGVGYRNALSTAVPWITPLAFGVFAAAGAEFGYRMLAIPLFLRWCRWRWLALAIPGILWGLVQGSGSSHPTWILCLGLGLIGVGAGWVFLRWGILATLVWNYTVQAVMVGAFLFRSSDPGFRIAGGLVADAVLLPAAIAGVFYLRWGGFLRRDSILNAADEPAAGPVTPVPPALPEPIEEGPITPSTTATTLARFAVAAVVIFAGSLFVHVPQVGDATTFQVNARQAEAIATRLLRSRGIPVERFQRLTSLNDSLASDGTDYLREHLSTRDIAGIYAGRLPLAAWRTRFSRPPGQEEYAVFVAPDGRVLYYRHMPEDKAPGAKLEKPEALARVQSFLAAQGVRLDSFRLIAHDLDRRQGRNDHTLTWESTVPLAGDARQRMTAWLNGDEANGPRHTIKVPESWTRQRPEQSRQIGRIALWLGLVIAALILFARGMARVSLTWRFHLSLGAGVACLGFLGYLNIDIRWWEQFYSEMLPGAGLSVGPALAVAFGIFQLLSRFLGATALSAMAEMFLVQRFGQVALWPGAAQRREEVLRALAGGACAALLMRGAEHLVAAAADRIPSAAVGLSSGLPSWTAPFSAVLNSTYEMLTEATFSAVAFVATTSLALRLFRSRVTLGIALIAVAALYASNAIDLAQFFKNWLEASVWLAAAAAVVSVLRFNVSGYFAGALIYSASATITPLWRHPAFRPVAVASLAVLVVMLAVFLLWALRKPRPPLAPERV